MHGVLPEEQARAQPFEVDLELDVDLEPAGESDELDDTVDYAAVCERCSRWSTTERYQLLERLAARIAEVCRATNGSPASPSRCASCIRRSAAMLDHVGVRIEQ